MSLEVKHELAELNAAISRYQEVTKKSPQDVLLKHGGEFAYALNRRFRFLAPAKGSIRSARLAAMKGRGAGVFVRPSVRARIFAQYGAHTSLEGGGMMLPGQTRFFRSKGSVRDVASVKRKGKTLNLQALAVQAELNLRESGRGFLGRSAKFDSLRDRLQGGGESRWLDRYTRLLAEAGLTVSTENGALTFTWEGAGGSGAATAIMGPKGQQQLAAALQDARANLEQYLARKFPEDAASAFHH
jgi:hypothetical protein